MRAYDKGLYVWVGHTECLVNRLIKMGNVAVGVYARAFDVYVRVRGDDDASVAQCASASLLRAQDLRFTL